MTPGAKIDEKQRKPELLAPAGDWECARAAVENGADAIYFGLERFNARMRANNFTEADLPKLMDFLHRRGVKGYVTFNTLVFANEMAEAEQYLRAIIAAGVDAAIVQDVGICRLIRRLSPDFPIHASTQMTITSAAGVEFARELGCHLVVLARECSIKEIEKIAAPVRAAAGSVCAWRVVRGLFRPMSDQRIAGRAFGQSRRMRPGLPHALRIDFRRPDRPAGRPPLSSQPAGSGRTGSPAGTCPRRRGFAENRRPPQIAGIRRQHHADLSARLGQSLPRRRRPTTRATTWRWPFRAGFTPAGSAASTTSAWSMPASAKSAAFIWAKSQRVGSGQRLCAPGSAAQARRRHCVRRRPSGRGGRRRTGFMLSNGGASPEIRILRATIDFSRVHAGDKLWKTSDPELDRNCAKVLPATTPHFRRPLDLGSPRRTRAAPLTLIGARRSRARRASWIRPCRWPRRKSSR